MSGCLFCFIAVLITASHAYRILFIPMPEGSSHRGSMYPLAEKLTANGHDVLIFSEVIMEQRPAPVKEHFVQLTHVDKDVYESFVVKNSTDFRNMMWFDDFSAITILFPWSMTCKLCSSLLTHQQAEFWQIANQHWDLILIDTLFAPCGMALATLYGAPYALIHTTFLETYVADYQGLPSSPHLTAPEFLSPEHTWNTKYFRSRLHGFTEHLTYHSIITNLIQYFVSRSISPVVHNFSYYNYIRNSQASFIEYPDVVDWPVSRGHDIFHIGCHCPVMKPLPEKLDNFVSDPMSKGTIIVAFGTLVDWTQAPKHMFDKLYDALVELRNYRILWQYTGDTSKFPKHIKALKWLPQKDILLHPKTKLFISHGGLKSFKETVCAEVPVLFLPLFAEQIRNAMIAEVRNFGIRLHKRKFTTSEVVEKALEILVNTSYAENVRKIKNQWMDHVIPPLDKGAFWTEYIIRHNGLPNLFQRQGKQMYWFQYWNLDVLVTFICAVVLMLMVAYHFVRVAVQAFIKACQ